MGTEQNKILLQLTATRPLFCVRFFHCSVFMASQTVSTSCIEPYNRPQSFSSNTETVSLIIFFIILLIRL